MNLRGVLTLFSILFLLPNTVAAMHIIGGEITYECLGDAPNNSKRYRFTMRIYRDCLGNGAPYDDPAEMAIYSGLPNGSTFTTVQTFQVFNPVITTLQPVPPDCIAQIPTVCVQQAIYTFERTLPVLANASYFIVYQRCCRNLTISNLINPGDVGATYAMELTAAAQIACNNSPKF